jgi:hypothetical protein
MMICANIWRTEREGRTIHIHTHLPLLLLPGESPSPLPPSSLPHCIFLPQPLLTPPCLSALTPPPSLSLLLPPPLPTCLPSPVGDAQSRAGANLGSDYTLRDLESMETCLILSKGELGADLRYVYRSFRRGALP